jgi:hypothetical protein
VLTLPGGRPVRLQRRGNLDALILTVRLGYTIVQRHDRLWDTAIFGWMFQVDGAIGRELFAYHWHPTGHSHVTVPHLHISGRTEPAEIGAAHYPTGPVTLADVVRLLIQDFDVRPRRADWSRVLDAATG